MTAEERRRLTAQLADMRRDHLQNVKALTEGDYLALLESENYVQAAFWPCDVGWWVGASRLSPEHPPAWDFEAIGPNRREALALVHSLVVKHRDRIEEGQRF